MLTILPMQEQDRKEELLREIPDAEKSAEILMMRDGEEELGYVAIDIKSSVVRMLKIVLGGNPLPEHLGAEDRFLVDSLMRATASYGANNGAYKIECREEAAWEALMISGFQKEGNVSVTELKNIVRYTPGQK